MLAIILYNNLWYNKIKKTWSSHLLLSTEGSVNIADTLGNRNNHRCDMKEESEREKSGNFRRTLCLHHVRCTRVEKYLHGCSRYRRANMRFALWDDRSKRRWKWVTRILTVNYIRSGYARKWYTNHVLPRAGTISRWMRRDLSSNYNCEEKHETLIEMLMWRKDLKLERWINEQFLHLSFTYICIKFDLKFWF